MRRNYLGTAGKNGIWGGIDLKVNAILPMKGNSERVPGKNMRLFAGRPLYHMIAGVLQDIPIVDTIIINTDSKQIADDAVKNFSKVKIHIRPDKIRGDMVSMNEIIAYDIKYVDKGDFFLQTHSTNPLLSKKTLEKALNNFFSQQDKYDSLFSVTPLQSRLYWADGRAVNHNPNELLRTQDLEPIFEENSNFYIFSRQSFLEAGNKRIGLRAGMFIVDKREAIDIDEEDDFQLAEYIYRMNNLYLR